MDNAIKVEVEKVEAKLSDFFKNVAGQFSADELLKVLAGVAGVILLALFFCTDVIAVEKGGYVMIAEGALWAYAFGQGLVGNVTKQ